jgi:hypothetical protein
MGCGSMRAVRNSATMWCSELCADSLGDVAYCTVRRKTPSSSS